MTKGYSFAFQVLGYFAWEEKGIIDGSEHGYVSFKLPMFDSYALDSFDGEV